MKFISFILLVFAYLNAEATFYSEKECEKNNAVIIEVTVTKDRFEPRLIYLQEKDKVCMFVTAKDYPVSMVVEKMPVSLTARPGKREFTYFTVPKVGEFNIKCNGGCALGVKPKIIVQSKEQFEKFQEEKYREKSENYRKKVGSDQVQPKYLDENETYRNKNKKDKNPYDKERYKSKFLSEESN